MEKYIFNESNGLWYELQGDYYIPCLAVPTQEEKPVGIWDSDTYGTLNGNVKPCILSC